jgi:hypothetical protein
MRTSSQTGPDTASLIFTCGSACVYAQTISSIQIFSPGVKPFNKGSDQLKKENEA